MNYALKLSFYILFLLFLSCQNKKADESKASADSVIIIPPATIINDSVALPLSKEILAVIKQKDYQKFTSYIGDGIRFSPYGYIDTTSDKKFTINDFSEYAINKKNTKFTWGNYDGSGDKILLTINDYFEKFVYDVDFLNAPQLSLNKTLAYGNSLNNIDSLYKNCIYTEFYFPGFEEKYGGMDWRSLKLVFRKNINKLYLIAIIHDQWTI